MKRGILFLLKAFCFLCFGGIISIPSVDAYGQENHRISYDVIPLPQEIVYGEGDGFKLNENTLIVFAKGDDIQRKNACFLQQSIKEITNIELKIEEDPGIVSNAIRLRSDLSHPNKEAYRIDVNSALLVINGACYSGTFYGIQTIYKSIVTSTGEKNILFPAVTINDCPRFAYRGMMLDVCRHFFPVSFIKEYIDLLALHNMNRFHWHLSDDQGWRIEINSYPRLTTIGASRKNAVPNAKTALFKEDGSIYGPYFYTKDQIREIVQYARDRFIEIIPEVDIPGHTTAVLASYPELGCTGGPYKVANSRGIYRDVLCLGNEKTYEFLNDVFNELADLFPYKYIHIGGDETPRERWRECPKCKNKAVELQIPVDDLQGHCVRFIDKLLQEKKKSIIGWDEILNNDPPRTTTIMGWRGSNSVVSAAKKGYKVIAAPNSHMYFDYAQSEDIENDPICMGNYLPVERVYSYHPEDGLSVTEQKNVLGVQANLWTEFLSSEEAIEFMVLPRMDALSEVQWCSAENRNYSSFLLRLQKMFGYYSDKEYHFSKHLYDVRFDIKKEEDRMSVTLSTIDNAPIYYTLDGTEPGEKSLRYSGNPVIINHTATLKAIAWRNDNRRVFQNRSFSFNKATNKKISIHSDISGRFGKEGPTLLVDGILGTSNYRDGRWVSFDRENMDVTIDLGKTEYIQSVAIRSYTRLDNRVFGAGEMEIQISEDGKSFQKVFSRKYPEKTPDTNVGIKELQATFKKIKARFIQIILSKPSKVPEWHISSGARTLMFIDEIIID